MPPTTTLPTAAPFADIETRLTQAMALLANATVQPVPGEQGEQGEPGQAFPALFDAADATAFDFATVADYRLRYATAAASLHQGQRVLVNGVAYRVAAHPRRIGSGQETVAALVEDR